MVITFKNKMLWYFVAKHLNINLKRCHINTILLNNILATLFLFVRIDSCRLKACYGVFESVSLFTDVSFLWHLLRV